MCGINGIFGLENLTGSANDIIKKMNDALAHRGPDATGIALCDNLILGHRRLSIIDLSPESNQPMIGLNNQYTIVYNGELYNYNDLKTQLKDYPFKTKSDTEVILAAYHKWGYDCVNHFNGMWAFALWDNNRKELFISRDRLGVKPLYYYKNDRGVIFSSEIRALLASDLVPRKLNTNALFDYFSYQTIHAPETIVKDVFMLMPGHNMIIGDTETKIYSYWNIAENYHSQAHNHDYNQAKKNVYELLYKAVERRLVSDVSFGAFLSGGIDSTAIVALMSQASSSQVSTFSVIFHESDFSEAHYAKLVAQKYKTAHHEILLNPNDLLNLLPYTLKAMDFPSADGPNTYLVSKAVKDAGISMALSGLGGDELFAGYPVFNRMKNLQSLQWLQYFPYSLRKITSHIYKTINPSIKADKLSEFLCAEYFRISDIYPLSRKIFTDSTICQILKYKKTPPNRVKKIVSQLLEQGTPGSKLQNIAQTSICEISTYLQNVLLRDTDQMSMAHALEVRVPFLDYLLVEYVLALPDEYKTGKTNKKLLTESLGDLIPNEIINREKMGFTLPWEKWMKNELMNFCNEKISALSQRSFVDSNEIIGLWRQYLAGNKKLNWSRIWGLIVLENWLTQHNIE